MVGEKEAAIFGIGALVVGRERQKKGWERGTFVAGWERLWWMERGAWGGGVEDGLWWVDGGALVGRRGQWCWKGACGWKMGSEAWKGVVVIGRWTMVGGKGAVVVVKAFVAGRWVVVGGSGCSGG